MRTRAIAVGLSISRQPWLLLTLASWQSGELVSRTVRAYLAGAWSMTSRPLMRRGRHRTYGSARLPARVGRNNVLDDYATNRPTLEARLAGSSLAVRRLGVTFTFQWLRNSEEKSA